MFNLDQEFKAFIAKYPSTPEAQDWLEEGERDVLLLEAIGEEGCESKAVDLLLKWWSDYGIGRNIPAGQHKAAAEMLVQHAREIIASQLKVVGPELLKKEFDRLERRFREVLNLPLNKDGTQRGIESFTSKNLWLCFPQHAPMLDANVESALRVVGRLCGLKKVETPKRYDKFIETWFDAYRLIKMPVPPIPRQLYTVGVFDKYLLWLSEGP